MENIKFLREKHGASISDCKTALEESGGNLEQAAEILRKKGIIKAANKLGLKNMTPAIIADKARKGNPQALRVYEKFSEYLAAGIGSLINIFNPDMLTFSGGVSNNWDLIEKRFFNELKKRAFKTPREHVKIIKSRNPENLGAIGAVLLTQK